MVTKRVSLLAIGTLVMFSFILGGVAWYVRRDREISAQDKMVEQFDRHHFDFNLKLKLIQEGLWTSENAGSNPDVERIWRNDPSKNMGHLQAECQRLWGMEMGEVLHRYNQRYPWKKVRLPPR